MFRRPIDSPVLPDSISGIQRYADWEEIEIKE